MSDPGVDGRSVRSEFGLDDRFVVLYAGAHGLAHDLGVVLQAADCLGERQDVVLAFVGDSREKPNLTCKAKETALSNVIFAPA